MRLDELLVKRGLAESLKEAQALVMANQVLVNDEPAEKPGRAVDDRVTVRLRGQQRWVARSGEKLYAALQQFQFSVEGRSFVDIGCSTGGFTQVLLELGASRVLAIDVAYGFLHPALRSDNRVVVRERTNICQVDQLEIDADAFVMDVSFIHPLKVLKHLQKLKQSWQGLVLFKPQFVAAESQLSGGIVKPESLPDLVAGFEKSLAAQGIEVEASMPAAIKGTRGNQEYMYWLQWVS